MARKKNVIRFPGKWENLHDLTNNLNDSTQDYFLMTIDKDGTCMVSSNYEAMSKNRRKNLAAQLEEELFIIRTLNA